MKGLDLSQMLAAFLLTRHITPHTKTRVPPAELLMRRTKKSRLDLIEPTLSDKAETAQSKQKFYHDLHTKNKTFDVGDRVYAKNLCAGDQRFEGVVVDITGPLSYRVKLSDGRVLRRHQDHLRTRWNDERQGEPFPLSTQTPLHSIPPVPTSSPMPAPHPNPPAVPVSPSVGVGHPEVFIGVPPDPSQTMPSSGSTAPHTLIGVPANAGRPKCACKPPRRLDL